jgi:hypothetical protein
MNHSTSEILKTAAIIAANCEDKGQPITATEAIERSIAGRILLMQMQRLHEMEGDCDATVIEPPLPAELLVEAGFAA